MKNYDQFNNIIHMIYLSLILALMLLTSCKAEEVLPKQGNCSELPTNGSVPDSSSMENSALKFSSETMPKSKLLPISTAPVVEVEPVAYSLLPNLKLPESSRTEYTVPMPESLVKIQSPYLLMQIDSFIVCPTNKIDNFEMIETDNLEPVPCSVPKNAKPIRTYQLVSASFDIPDVVRYTYRFYQSGILVQTDIPSLKSSNSSYYSLNSDSYDKLLINLDNIYRNVNVWYPMWPLYAVAQNIDDVTFTSSDKKHHKSYTEPMDSRLNKWQEIPYIYPVHKDSAKITPKSQTIENAAIITVKYKNGVVFEIWQNGNELLVSASNMDYCVLYQAMEPDSSTELIYVLNRLAQGKAIPMNT